MENIARERSARHASREMTKLEAAGRARTLKRVLTWAALLTFAVLCQAATHHLTGVTSRIGATTTQAPGIAGGGGQTQSDSQGFSFGSGQNVQSLTLTQTAVS